MGLRPCRDVATEAPEGRGVGPEPAQAALQSQLAEVPAEQGAHVVLERGPLDAHAQRAGPARPNGSRAPRRRRSTTTSPGATGRPWMRAAPLRPRGTRNVDGAPGSAAHLEHAERPGLEAELQARCVHGGVPAAAAAGSQLRVADVPADGGRLELLAARRPDVGDGSRREEGRLGRGKASGKTRGRRPRERPIRDKCGQRAHRCPPCEVITVRLPENDRTPARPLDEAWIGPEDSPSGGSSLPPLLDAVASALQAGVPGFLERILISCSFSRVPSQGERGAPVVAPRPWPTDGSGRRPSAPSRRKGCPPARSRCRRSPSGPARCCRLRPAAER